MEGAGKITKKINYFSGKAKRRQVEIV